MSFHFKSLFEAARSALAAAPGEAGASFADALGIPHADAPAIPLAGVSVRGANPARAVSSPWMRARAPASRRLSPRKPLTLTSRVLNWNDYRKSPAPTARRPASRATRCRSPWLLSAGRHLIH